MVEIRGCGRRRFATAAVTAVLAALPAVASAGTYNWSGFSGSPYLDLPFNWQGDSAPMAGDNSTTMVFGQLGAILTPVDRLGYVVNSVMFQQGTAPYNLSSSASNIALTVDGSVVDQSTFPQTISEPIKVPVNETWPLGQPGSAATLNITGGITSTTSMTIDGTGTLTMAGSSSIGLNFNVDNVNMAITGGTFNATGKTGGIYLANAASSSTTAVLSGGNVTVTNLEVGYGSGATATFNQSGGTLKTVTNFDVPETSAASGTYLLSGTATANFAGMVIGAPSPGVVNQSGGTLTSTGRINVGNATYVLSGGTINCSSADFEDGYLGNAPSLVLMSGGTLNTQELDLGLSESATFNMSGGSLNTGTVEVAFGTTGTFYLSGGTVTGPVFVGNQGKGLFVQTGGTVNADSGGITLSSSFGSPGTYQLSGGVIQTGLITGSNGPSLLQINGGQIVFNQSYAGGLQELTATILGGGASFNVPTGIVTRVAVSLQRDSSVSVDGGVTKLGGGVLELQSGNYYNGPTVVQAGTLIFGYGYDGSQGTINPASGVTVNSGATLQLGDANQNLVLGAGAVTNIAPVTVAAGGAVTEAAGTEQAFGSLTLTGGTVTGSGSPPAGSTDFTLTGNVNLTGSINSTITAAGGIALAGTISFTVGAGGGEILVQAPLVDAPGNPGALNKLGRGAALVLSGDDTYTGPTSITAGLLQLTPTASLPNSAVSVTGKLEFTAQPAGSTPLVRPLSTLTIQTAGRVTVDAPPAPVDRQLLVVRTLTFSAGGTGLLDLTGNDLDVQTGSLPVVTSQVAEGYNLAGGANWQGSIGITSSSAAADTSHLTALGVIQNNQSGAALFTSANPFDTYTPAAGDILVKYTYFGDANLDGKVDGSDYSLIDAGYASHGSLTGWYHGDFNYDGVIDGSDYTLIDNAFNNQTGNLSTSALVAAEAGQVGVAPTAVPEPALGAIAAIAGALICRRRRSLNRTLEELA